MQTNTSFQLTLRDVRHVLDVRLNMLAMNALDKEGYEQFMGNGAWRLSRGSLLVAKGKLCCTLYKTQMKIFGAGRINISGQINAAGGVSSADLWHKRLGHMSEKGLQLLAKQSHIPIAKDNGGKYTFGEFRKYCEEHGIWHEKTVSNSSA